MKRMGFCRGKQLKCNRSHVRIAVRIIPGNGILSNPQEQWFFFHRGGGDVIFLILLLFQHNMERNRFNATR